MIIADKAWRGNNMSKTAPEGFDPLRDQAERKLEKERSSSQRKILRNIFGVVLLVFFVVVGMYAIGGTGDFSEWMALRKSLSEFGDGAREESNELVKLVTGIDSVRGNRSALAGVYCVYALQMIQDGNSKNAGRALGVLKKEYASKRMFAELWSRNNLTEECPVCSMNSKGTKCSSCNGSGWLSSSSKLKNSKSGKVVGGSRKECPVCSGKGRIVAEQSNCKSCGGSGRVLSPSLVSPNLEKSVKRAKLMVNLKCLQCAVSLRPLF